MLAVLLGMGSGVAWADNNVSTVSTKFSATGNVTSKFSQTGDFTNASWDLAVTWKSSASWNNLDGTKGTQVGSNNNPATGIVLTGSGISGTISSVVVNTSGASSVNATVAVTVGGTTFKYNGNNTASLTSSAANYEFTGSGSGNIVITWANSSNKAIYIKSVTTTYSATSLEDNDLALTGAPIDLSFDLYNNSDAQVINYTTSSTGAVTVATSDYINAVVNESAKTITVTPVKKTASAQTITVNQAADATYAAGSATFTVSVANSAPATVYEKVTDASTLRAGDKFLFVYEEGPKAMGAANGSYYTGVDVILDNSQISITDEEVDVITLGGSAGAWTFYESLGEKYLALTSATNALHTAENAEETTAQWTIRISNGVATVQNVGTTGRTLKWNSGSPRFACYTSGQSSIAIYRKQDSRLATTLTFADALNLDLNGGASVIGDLAAAVLKAGDDVIGETVTYTIAPNEGLTYNASTGKATATAIGTYTITASYAGDATYKAADDAVCTVTVENSAIVTPPTLSIASGTAVTYGTIVTISDPDDDYMYFYTTDDSDPACDGNLEATGTSAEFPVGGLSITAATNLKVVAANASSHLSDVVTASYTIAAPAAPTLDTAAGAIDEGTVVKVNDYDSDLLYFYTTDGSNPAFAELSPTGTTQAYDDNTGIMINEALTLKVIAVDLGGNASEVTSAAYTIKAVPVIDLRGKETAVEFTEAGFTTSGSGYKSYGDATVSDTEDNDYEGWKITDMMKSTGIQLKASTGKIQMPLIKSDAGFTVTATMANNHVTISDGTNSETDELTVSATDATITISATASYAKFTKLTITPTVIKSVATPVITLAEGTYEEVKTTTITCETDGATIYYTTDGTEPTDESTEYDGGDIEINESMTIKAIAYLDSESSYVASATYTIDLPLTTIAQVKALESGTDFRLNLTGAQVVYIDAAKKNIYVRDASGAIDLYNNRGFDTSLTTGDFLSGTISGRYSPYNNLPEIINIADISVLTRTSNETVVAKVIDGTTAAIQANLCDLVKIANTEITESNSKYYVGENSDIQLYDNFKVGYEVTTGAAVDVQGIATVYGSTYELFPRVAEDIVYLATSEAVAITSSTGYASFSSTNALDFSAADAFEVYIATQTNKNTIHMERIYKVPANTGVILKSANGGAVESTNIPYLTESADDCSANLLLVSDDTVEGDDNTIFALGVGKVEPYVGVVGFYLVNDGQTIPAGKAYMVIPAGGGTKGFTFDFSGLATGINTIANSQQPIANSPIYNLAGQRMSKMQRGVNIVNGKKVLVK